jgi:hypothetical protein
MIEKKASAIIGIVFLSSSTLASDKLVVDQRNAQVVGGSFM